MASNTIHNLAKLKRPVDFSGLPHVGTCSPSDVDFIVDVEARKRVLVGDFKEHGKQLSPGQNRLLVNQVRVFELRGYAAIAFLAWHAAEVETIDAATSLVAAYYSRGVWTQCNEPLETLRTRYERFFGIVTPVEYDAELDALWEGVHPA